MIATARRERILQVVHTDGTVRTSELAHQLGVSEVTIRSDLEDLERRGHLARTHGGAVATLASSAVSPFDERASRNAAGKRRIAIEAAKFVRDNQTVIFDAGTTVFALAHHLPTVTDLTVVTPSIDAAIHLMKVEGVEVYVLGGRVIPDQRGTVGSAREQGLDRLIAHTAFLGAHGVDRDHDIVESSLEIAATKRHLAAAARHTVVLADSSKWFATDRSKVLSLAGVDTVITDSGLAPSVCAQIRDLGVTLIVAEA
jgi:DeoR family transcriptional regulator of aga operon